MLQGNGLGSARENHLVLADDSPHAQRVDSDFILRTQLMSVSAADKAGVLSRFFDFTGQHQRRAARRVELCVVMLLDDFDIRVRKKRRGAPCDIFAERNTGIVSAAAWISSSSAATCPVVATTHGSPRDTAYSINAFVQT